MSNFCLIAALMDQLNDHRHLHRRPLPRRHRMERTQNQKGIRNRTRIDLKSARASQP